MRYNGSGPWETFLFQFDNCATYNDWSKDDKTHQLKGCLEGQAAQTIAGLDKDATYAEVCQELKLCFGLEGNETQAEAQLRMRKRGRNEKLQDLYQDIQRLVLLAYPGTKSELRDRLAVEAFTSSLNDRELELRVRDRSTKDLLTCFRTAQTLEANQKLVNGEEHRRRDDSKKERDIQARAINVAEIESEDKGSKLVKELGELIAGIKNASSSGKVSNNNRRSRDNNYQNRNSRNESNVRQLYVENQTEENSNDNWSPRWSSDERPYDNGYDYHTYQIQGSAYQKKTNYPSRNPAPQGSGQFNDSREFVPQWQQNRTSSSNQNSQGATRGKGDFYCFYCGEPGHMSRNCPHKGNNGNSYRNYSGEPNFNNSYDNLSYQPQTQNTEQNNRVGVIGVGSVLSYLPVKYRGKNYEFIMDSGSGITIVPPYMVSGQKVMPTKERAVAVNNAPVSLEGELMLCVRIGRHSVWIRALVSKDVNEPVLGKDFMMGHKLLWDMGRKEITFKGDVIRINDRPWSGQDYRQNIAKEETKTKIFCHGCGRPGHVKRFCRFLKKVKETSVRNLGLCSGQVTPNGVGVKKNQNNHVGRRDSTQTNVKQHWRSNSGSSAGSSGSQASQDNLLSIVQCYGCGQVGHSIQNCPYGQSKREDVISYGEISGVREFEDKPSFGGMYGSSGSSLSLSSSELLVGSGEQFVPYLGMEFLSQPAWGWGELARPVNCIIA